MNFYTFYGYFYAAWIFSTTFTESDKNYLSLKPIYEPQTKNVTSPRGLKKKIA